MKEHVIELLLLCVTLLLAGSTLNPYWMPMGMQMLSLLLLVILFGSYALFVWQERKGDEREETLKHMSDRFAFLVGALILVVAIVFEGFLNHEMNPWILGAFFAMTLAKILSSVYNRHTH